MEFHKKGADLFIPDGVAVEQALARGRYLAVGAHQDDLEIMAFDGIIRALSDGGRSFVGVTCTNGAGSARVGRFSRYSDLEMQAVRRVEQRNAAVVGSYAAQVQLDYSSSEVKASNAANFEQDLQAILKVTKPHVVYTHNLADKHDTHVAVAISLIKALRALPSQYHPHEFYGCEVWRSLDWVQDCEKVALNVGGYGHLAAAQLGLYDSQIAGGKRYDLATLGRRQANATYFESHAVDQASELTFAIDLMPLLRDPGQEIEEYLVGFIDRFESDVRARLRKKLGVSS